MESLIKSSNNLLKITKSKILRYLYKEIDFNERMIGIVGQRGVGKTTLILQYLKSKKNLDEIIYLSADDVYFLENSLRKTIEELYYNFGFRVFAVDEIHKYQNWNQELKNIYDLLPDVQIIFSGSSSLDVVKGAYDLSRRAIMYNLYGLSFREFIEFKEGVKFEKYELKELLENYKKYSLKISNKINVNLLFKEYLSYGYYPYYFEGNKKNFLLKMKNALDKTIYEDISNIASIKTDNLVYFKKILNFFAGTNPVEINIGRLSSNLGIAFETVENYLDLLQRISLVRFLPKNKDGYSLIKQSTKAFLENSNLSNYLKDKLALDENIGLIRELFLLSQVQNSQNQIFAPKNKKGDFVLRLDGRDYLLELGGKSKKFSQIANIDNSFLVLDGIEIAEKNKIPLYLFGFLY